MTSIYHLSLLFCYSSHPPIPSVRERLEGALALEKGAGEAETLMEVHSKQRRRCHD